MAQAAGERRGALFEFLIYRVRRAGIAKYGGHRKCDGAAQELHLRTGAAFERSANMIIDDLCRRLYNKPYDEEGRLPRRDAWSRRCWTNGWLCRILPFRRPRPRAGSCTRAVVDAALQEFPGLPENGCIRPPVHRPFHGGKLQALCVSANAILMKSFWAAAVAITGR
jgi:hypothetical protein